MTSKITKSGSISSECWLVNMLLLGEINFFFPSQFMSSKNFIGNETSVAVSEKCPIQFNFVLNIEQLIAEISPQCLNYSIFICYLAFWLMVYYIIPKIAASENWFSFSPKFFKVFLNFLTDFWKPENLSKATKFLSIGSYNSGCAYCHVQE